MTKQMQFAEEYEGTFLSFWETNESGLFCGGSIPNLSFDPLFIGIHCEHRINSYHINSKSRQGKRDFPMRCKCKCSILTIWSIYVLHLKLNICIPLLLQPFCSLNLQLQTSENPYLSGTISTKSSAPGVIVATGKTKAIYSFC